MGYVISAFKLVRWRNCLLASVAVILGGYLETLEPDLLDLALTAIVAALICGGGNALNDRLDIEVDKVNHPSRPLPSGRLRTTEASIITIALFGSGNALASIISLPVFVITAAITIILFAYNYTWKQMPVVGNLVVALLGGITITVGGLAATGHQLSFPGSLYPAALAFLLHFARETTKDVQDMAGDRVAGFETLPIKKDAESALRLAEMSVALLVPLTLLPLLFDWYSHWYTVIVLAGVDLPLLVILYLLRQKHTAKRLQIASLVYKLGMVMGLLAVYMGVFSPAL